MDGLTPKFSRPVIPCGQRRAQWHDYRSRCIYLITINTIAELSPLSVVCGVPGDHAFPPVAEKTEAGKKVAEQLSALKKDFPFIKILRSVIMPEHIHFVVFVTESSNIHIGHIISCFKKRCYDACVEKRIWRGDNPIFEEGYHDRILIKSGQLQKMLRYVSDNPRRRLERMMHPDFYTRRVIHDSSGNGYETYGNIHLLEDPDIEAVKISSKYTADELYAYKKNWKHTIENCGVLVSPFISPAERRVRDWAMDNGGRLIIIQDVGFGPRFTPKGKLFDMCKEGRLLLIAFGAFSTSKQKLTRAKCTSMNNLAQEIAAGNFRKC